MRTLHVVMPMAGRGSRFANAGFTTPKPLIEVDGAPMFIKALSSLDGILAPKRITIIIREEHDTEYSLKKLLLGVLPKANIVVTNEEPIGAVKDALRSEDYLDPDEGVVVLDCDLWFRSRSYEEMLNASLGNKSNIAGGLLTFFADNPRYSYALIGENNRVTETREKQVISNHAITGSYYFAYSTHFINSAKKLIGYKLNEKMPEYYLSLLYNILIDEGKQIQAAFVDAFASFGTPEELSDYQKNNKEKQGYSFRH